MGSFLNDLGLGHQSGTQFLTRESRLLALFSDLDVAIEYQAQVNQSLGVKKLLDSSWHMGYVDSDILR
jgi:hypothetical protein